MKKIIILILLVSVSLTLFGRRNKRDLFISTSYITPINNADFNSSLMIGLSSKFWGIFHLTANGYMEINRDAEKFSEAFYAPEVFSLGVGATIPLGGFSLTGDYQRLLSLDSDSENISISKYSDSYKLGVVVDITRDIDVEVYHRTLIYKDAESYFDDNQGILGLGLNFYL